MWGAIGGRAARRALSLVLSLALSLAPSFALSLLTGPAHAQTLDKIRKSGVITLGYIEGAAPFSFTDGNNEPQGYSVELCRAVAAGVLRVDFRLFLVLVALGRAGRYAAIVLGVDYLKPMA